MANNFTASWNNLTKLAHMVWCEAGMKIWVQIFRGPAPLKFAGAKLEAISDNLDFDRKYLRIGSGY